MSLPNSFTGACRSLSESLEQAVLFDDQVEHVVDGANALAGLPVVLARHNARITAQLFAMRTILGPFIGAFNVSELSSVSASPASTAALSRALQITVGNRRAC